MKLSLRTGHLFLCLFALITFQCSDGIRTAPNREQVREEIERILKIQEDAYDEHSDAGRAVLAATCVDSLIFIGGDDGGQATSSQYYVNDLADGYTQRPSQRTFRIFENTVVVTSIHQSFKLFNQDTIFFNARATKVLVKFNEGWKMVFTTYAPLPVMYGNARNVGLEVLEKYAGRYSAGELGTDTVIVADNKLWVGGGGERTELVPINDSTFFTRDYFGRTGFIWKGEQVTGYYYEFPDGQRLTFPRIRE